MGCTEEQSYTEEAARRASVQLCSSVSNGRFSVNAGRDVRGRSRSSLRPAGELPGGFAALQVVLGEHAVDGLAVDAGRARRLRDVAAVAAQQVAQVLLLKHRDRVVLGLVERQVGGVDDGR